MLFTPIFAAALAAIPTALAQDVPIEYNSAHNVTPIVGTWSSGSKQVVTGAVSTFLPFLHHKARRAHRSQGFASPANMSFTYPPVTGVSYAL